MLLINCFLLSNLLFAQEADVKKNKILSDGQALANIEKEGCKALSPTCTYYINSLDSDELLITIIELDMIDPMQSSAGNPEGRVRFLRFSFVGIDGIAEIKNPALLNTRPKDIAKSIVKAQLIKDGKLNSNAVQNFIQVNGSRYSDRQKEINPQLIIIENRN